ncbi:MAG: hypothetical protein Pg6B_08680 [Candidatus Azobacteroides pseudotrichonymphae]|jgi:hypothetical protein|nr:MAG: hypothetical protein Pg6B_08680 [Candidatus Azobacteroides pseudotrichonymphae]
MFLDYSLSLGRGNYSLIFEVWRNFSVKIVFVICIIYFTLSTCCIFLPMYKELKKRRLSDKNGSNDLWIDTFE